MSIFLGYIACIIILYIVYKLVYNIKSFDLNIINTGEKISFFFVFYLGIVFIIGKVLTICSYFKYENI